MNSLSKVLDSVIHKTTTNGRSDFPPRVAEAFVPELTEATFGCVALAQKIEICRFAPGSALHMHERHEAKKKVYPKFPEENIASVKLQAEQIFGILAPFVKMFRV